MICQSIAWLFVSSVVRQRVVIRVMATDDTIKGSRVWVLALIACDFPAASEKHRRLGQGQAGQVQLSVFSPESAPGPQMPWEQEQRIKTFSFH
jgi:hypothetical protein